MKTSVLAVLGIAFLWTALAVASPSHSAGGSGRGYSPTAPFATSVRWQLAPGVTPQSYTSTQTGSSTSSNYYYGRGGSGYGYGASNDPSIDNGPDSRAPKGYVTRPGGSSQPGLRSYNTLDARR